MVPLAPLRSALRHRGLTVVSAVMLMLFSSDLAFACLCDGFTPQAAARNAATVFTGVVRGRVAPPAGVRSEVRIEFNVETVYKGDAPSRWSVSVNATDCGYVFSDGERYTVFVTGEGKTNLCMGNVRGAIDPATYGVQAITTYPSQPIDLDRSTDRLALAAILAIALGTVLAIVTVRLLRSRSA